MTPDIQKELIKLKQFEYQSPGFDFPKWRLEFVNDLKNKQINAIFFCFAFSKIEFNNFIILLFYVKNMLLLIGGILPFDYCFEFL